MTMASQRGRTTPVRSATAAVASAKTPHAHAPGGRAEHPGDLPQGLRERIGQLAVAGAQSPDHVDRLRAESSGHPEQGATERRRGEQIIAFGFGEHPAQGGREQHEGGDGDQAQARAHDDPPRGIAVEVGDLSCGGPGRWPAEGP